ncbi:hypothetical protein psyc5s11_29090 [Clostridium gelidum]|uniref:Uncharacterized protein n=1 Tax=Clostridium gelidum TaxID=704125 RepID=A0ABM7T4L8_9CLOT|nr:hypothetical protein [Clostridium gelidum]BCZ46842.1 hypothetical protein psyc5s11_29090 [Clostridium gelidum]
MESFWGKNLDKKSINTPKKILEEQSAYLEKETGGYVFTEVINKTNGHKRGSFELVYVLKAKYFEDYSYKLFSLSHDAIIYPSFIVLEGHVFDEVNPILNQINDVECEEETCEVIVKTEKSFIDTLKVILSSEEVGNLVSGIMTITNDYL